MDSNESYEMLTLKLKLAEKQKEANKILLKAKEIEWEIESPKKNRQEELINIHEYLLKVNFGFLFATLYDLERENNLDVIIQELEHIISFSGNYNNGLEYRLEKNHPLNLGKIGMKLAREFHSKYNRFLALGHPGYEFVKSSGESDSLRHDAKLYLMKDSTAELERLFHKDFSNVESHLLVLYNAKIEKEMKIAEAKKILAENS